MREIDPRISGALANGENFVYCFTIEKENIPQFFTSHDKNIVIKNKIYLPDSGLNIENFTFNDSAQDNIEITGIFEEKAITEDVDLTGYKIKIDIFFLKSQLQHNICEYFCSHMVKNGLSFKMILEPISHKLQKTIVESYGASCRANLGDNRCLVDKTFYPSNIICDKKFITCCNKFNNAVNFRGEPFIPEIT